MIGFFILKSIVFTYYTFGDKYIFIGYEYGQIIDFTIEHQRLTPRDFRGIRELSKYYI